MKFGLRYASLGRYSNGPAAVEVAQAAEAAGSDSIWSVEHVVVPDGYQPRYPYTRAGGWLGDEADHPRPADLAGLHRRPRARSGWHRDPDPAPAQPGGDAKCGLARPAGRRRPGAAGHRGGLARRGVRGARGALRGPRAAHRRVRGRDARAAGARSRRGSRAASSLRPAFCRPRPRTCSRSWWGATAAAARRAGRLGDGFFPARTPVARPARRDAPGRGAGRAGPEGHRDHGGGAGRPRRRSKGWRGRGSPAWRCRSATRRGCPTQVKTPDDVLRYGKDVIARFR